MPPPREKLKRAFRVLPWLTSIDATIMARDAFGILITDLSFEDASLLKAALEREGIEVEVVDTIELVPLPPAMPLASIECRSEHLVVTDALARESRWKWSDVAVVAAGNVSTTTFRFVSSTPTPHEDHSAPFDNSRHKEEQRLEMTVEIFLKVAPARLRVAVRECRYFVPGQSLRSNPSERYVCLIRDLLQHAPGAATNRAVHAAQQEPPRVFRYPSKHAFEEEITWWLRRMQRQG